jgi:hypothetical protein
MDDIKDLIDLIAEDEQPYQITDKIKDILYMKSSDMIHDMKPQVAASLFKAEE